MGNSQLVDPLTQLMAAAAAAELVDLAAAAPAKRRRGLGSKMKSFITHRLTD